MDCLLFSVDVVSGGDVWVLVIKNSKPSDSGIYVCEVNSNPIVRSFHKLSGEFTFLMLFHHFLCISCRCLYIYSVFCVQMSACCLKAAI